MNSKKLECTPRRQFRARSPLEPRGDHDDRWRDPQRVRSITSRDSRRTYYGEDPMDCDGTKEKHKYSDSLHRSYSKEPSHRNRNQKSPSRRCVIPDKSGGDGEYTRFRDRSPETSTSQEHRVSEGRKSLPSNAEDHFQTRRLNSDFRSWPPTKEDIDYGKRPEVSRKRRPSPEDFAYRQPSEYALDRRTQDRTVTRDIVQLPESSSKVYDPKQDQNESNSHLNYNPWLPSTGFPVSETSRRVEYTSTNHSPAPAKGVTEQTSRSNGFQRFLSVLNKGVDVKLLTKIVTQSDSVPESRHTGDPLGSHGGPGAPVMNQKALYWNNNPEPQQQQREQQRGQQREQQREQQRGQQREQQREQQRGQQREQQRGQQREQQREQQRGQQRGQQGEQPSTIPLSYETPDTHPVATSPRLTPTQAVVEVKVTQEQKCKEMQHLFQTIGMDLGLDELGQISNRIQQRLYGNKEDREKRESEKEMRRETRQMFSPACNSRSSSSSRSSFGPPHTQHNPLKNDALEAPVNIPETDQGASVGNSASVGNYDGDRACQESSATLQSFAPNTSYDLPHPQAPTVVMPSYPSAPFSQHLYPPTAYNIRSPPWGTAAATMPSYPYPQSYHPGHTPAPSAQTPPTPTPNKPTIHLKPSRHRYLQVIDTANKT